jgi:hypothetical protein
LGFAVDELLPARLAGPTGQLVDLDERVIASIHKLDLGHHRDLVDEAAIAREAEPRDGAEEAEPDAASSQHLVERREDRVAHARLHLVHERAAVAEHQSE